MTASITDFGQFTTLRASAERDDPEVLREVASQFEALFVQSLLKNMRGAQLAEPMFGSEQMDMYQDMFDQQISLEMANGRGIGFADMLVRQLGGDVTPSRSYGPLAVAPPRQAAGPVWAEPEAFVSDAWPHAERAAGKLGVAPQAVMAQAALETGWGAHVMRTDSGEPAYNVFGIKAGSDWQGDTVARRTVEYRDGVAEQRVERFRAYPDLATAFDDYAKLIGDNPRYQAVRGSDAAEFGNALQQAGYATDPRYAEKIDRVLGSDTLRGALDRVKNPGSLPITAGNTSVAGD